VVPAALSGYRLELAKDGAELVYSFHAEREGSGIADLLREVAAAGVGFSDLETRQSSLEDIFVGLVKSRA